MVQNWENMISMWLCKSELWNGLFVAFSSLWKLGIAAAATSNCKQEAVQSLFMSSWRSSRLCGEAKSKQEEGLQYAPKLLGLAIMPLVELAANPGLQGTMKAWSVLKQLLMLHRLGILLWKKNVGLIWSSRHQICYSKQMAWLLHSLLQICGWNVQKHSMI